MNKNRINGELSVPCPAGFEVMGAEELDRVYTGGSANRWGMWNRERHVMITVLWQRYNPLLARLADMKAMARRNEQLNRKGYQDHGYSLEGFFSRTVCGMAGEGYRFTYRVGDADQRMETLLVKRGSVVYSLNCVGRAGDSAGNRALFEEVLDGIDTNP